MICDIRGNLLSKINRVPHLRKIYFMGLNASSFTDCIVHPDSHNSIDHWMALWVSNASYRVLCVCLCSSILCIPLWGACGGCVFPMSWLHQSKHLSAAVPLPGLSLWEQLFVHGAGSLRLPLLQTRSRHWFQITSLWMWWVTFSSGLLLIIFC